MSKNDIAPIIIKRKKVVAGGGHHGGAWKVAYADFVTAMMAFFMLMWLLNATTETQRKGLADYFSPTIAVARVSGGGDGAFGGDSLSSEKTMSQTGRGGFTHQPPGGLSEFGAAPDAEQVASKETETLEKLQEGLIGKGGESLLREMALEHIVTRLTDEGLIIEIFDLENRRLFEDGSDIPTPLLLDIAGVLAETFDLVTNQVAIGTHTRAFPQVLRQNPAWVLATSRSQVMRRLMERQNFAPDRVQRITGFGGRSPLVEDPMDVRNNRVVLTLLRDNN